MVETIMWMFGHYKAKIIVNIYFWKIVQISSWQEKADEKIFNRILTNMFT